MHEHWEGQPHAVALHVGERFGSDLGKACLRDADPPVEAVFAVGFDRGFSKQAEGGIRGCGSKFAPFPLTPALSLGEREN
jgi:hypothetical protein